MSTLSGAKRISDIDVCRGLMMIFMALDHVNFFIGKNTYISGEFWGGTFGQHPDVLSLVTRLMGHFCPTGFLLFMGMGAHFFTQNRLGHGWTTAEIAKYFIKRGLILIVLQFTLENLAWSLTGYSPYPIYFGVLFGLGASMIFLPFFLTVPNMLLVFLTVLIFVAAQVFVPDQNEWTNSFSVLERIFYTPGLTMGLDIYYPILQWLSMGMIGIGLGRVYTYLSSQKRDLPWGWMGLVLLVAFYFVRMYSGSHGNLRDSFPEAPWDLFYMTKYPPSTAYFLFTLGGIFISYSLLKRSKTYQNKLTNFLEVYGRSPLFFYIGHLFLYGIFGVILSGNNPFSVVYVMWIIGILLLYYPCKMYGRFKQHQSLNSLWRLF